MRDGQATAFEHTKVPYGEDGRLVRGIIARCGNPNCDAAIPLPVNTFRQGDREADILIEWNFIARKLEAKGWRIGKSRSSHRCPKCFHAARMAAARKAKESAVTNTVQVVQENTRVMTREDRRIIFDKLNQVYVDGKVGYGPGWTDEKVSTDLGVPRAWVRLIRDENFGDEVSNESIRREIEEAKAALQEIRIIEPDIKRLLSIADKVEKSLAEIQKVFK